MWKSLLALSVVLTVATCLPMESGAAGELSEGELTSFIQESGLATFTEAKGPFTFAGTLQHVANRFCTEYTKPVGIGPTYCSELVLLQQKWIEADNSGERDAFMTYLGQLTGHYCPDAAATETSRCLVLQLLTKAVPATLKWNAEKKGYYQMTRDVATHYCKKLGKQQLFCPLLKALSKHFFDAVNTGDSKKYKKYIADLETHYCEGSVRNKPDQRCSILPLMKSAVPDLELVIQPADPSRHHTPAGTNGNVPAVDDEIMATTISDHANTAPQN